MKRLDRLRAQPALLAAVALVFIVAWFYRYNDPEGPVAGLTDDHFFYLARGWQMLFGDRPDRDFVDPGAPLTFLLEYGAQLALGRGVWPEIVFCVAALSIGSALTCWLAARASGSVLLGIAAAAFEVALSPRFYNYPKIVVYVLAIAALWAVIDRPTRRRWAVLALVTAVAFLWRHDHGAFVAVAAIAAIALSAGQPWRQRAAQAAVYGAMVLMLLAPYATYLAANGGIARHFDAASRWAARDRARAPLVLPAFALAPAVFTRPPEGLEPDAEWWLRPPFSGFTANYEPWLFWELEALPVAALLVLLLAPGAWRPAWPHARVKLAVVAILAIVLNVGFLRGRLSARFADVAEPQAVLAGWLLCVTTNIAWRGISPRGTRLPVVVRLLVGVASAAVTLVTILVLTPGIREQLEAGNLLKGPGTAWRQAVSMTGRMQANTGLEAWSRRDDPGPTKLAYYVRDCTAPGDRLLVSPYYPAVAPLAGRAFAGGHVDLRADFFNTIEDQRLTLARLQRQSVPIVVMPVAEEAVQFTRSFPLVVSYLRDRYVDVGVRDLGGGHVVDVLVDKRAREVRRYEPLDLPCFR